MSFANFWSSSYHHQHHPLQIDEILSNAISFLFFRENVFFLFCTKVLQQKQFQSCFSDQKIKKGDFLIFFSRKKKEEWPFPAQSRTHFERLIFFSLEVRAIQKSIV